MPLTDLAIRRTEPRSRPYKLADERGLALIIRPNGSRSWRLKFRFGGKEKSLSFGQWPEVGLAEARRRRDDARLLLRDGVDPAARRREARHDARVREETAFEAVAREWHAMRSPEWSESHAGYVLRRLEADVFPALGARPVDEIKAPEILKVLRKIERRGAGELARRLLQSISAVFRYAVSTSRAESDPTRDLRGGLGKVEHTHYAALDEKELPEFLRRLTINDVRMFETTRLAMLLMLHVFVRTSELIEAPWSEFDFEAREWNIPAERMKKHRPHIVPLSDQVVAMLYVLRSEHPDSRYLFPSAGGRAVTMSNGAILMALRRMGLKGRMTGHGARAIASTILHEMQFSPLAIERQLGHVEKSKTASAYNRKYERDALPERRRMMQAWSDYLDGIAKGATVIPLRRAQAG